MLRQAERGLAVWWGGLPKPFGVPVVLLCVPDAKHEDTKIQGLLFTLLGSGLALDQFLLAMLLFLNFGMGMLVLSLRRL